MSQASERFVVTRFLLMIPHIRILITPRVAAYYADAASGIPDTRSTAELRNLLQLFKLSRCNEDYSNTNFYQIPRFIRDSKGRRVSTLGERICAHLRRRRIADPRRCRRRVNYRRVITCRWLYSRLMAIIKVVYSERGFL